MTKAAPSVMVVIPARYGSSRFPGKPLVMLGRKPMIQHVYEQAAACRAVTEVQVATDDERIKQAVEGFGGRAVTTFTTEGLWTSSVESFVRFSVPIPTPLLMNGSMRSASKSGCSGISSPCRFTK